LRQQTTLARLGGLALRSDDLNEIFSTLAAWRPQP